MECRCWEALTTRESFDSCTIQPFVLLTRKLEEIMQCIHFNYYYYSKQLDITRKQMQANKLKDRYEYLDASIFLGLYIQGILWGLGPG